MAALKRRWMGFWFEPVEPTDLAVCRILFYGVLFALYLPADLAVWSQVARVFWLPSTFFEALGGSLPPPGIIDALQWIWLLSLLLSCIGLFTGASTKTAFILGIYLIGIAHNFGKFDAKDAILFPILAIMAFSRPGHALSIDRWWGRVRPESPTSGEYAWPIRMVWLVMVVSFFTAGVSKLRDSGLDWVLSDSLAVVLAHRNNPLSLFVASQEWLCHIIAGSTLLLELTATLALFSRRLRAVLIPSLFLMQVGFVVVMQILFHNLMLAYMFWVPWGRVLPRLRTPREPERPVGIVLRRSRARPSATQPG